MSDGSHGRLHSRARRVHLPILREAARFTPVPHQEEQEDGDWCTERATHTSRGQKGQAHHRSPRDLDGTHFHQINLSCYRAAGRGKGRLSFATASAQTVESDSPLSALRSGTVPSSRTKPSSTFWTPSPFCSLSCASTLSIPCGFCLGLKSWSTRPLARPPMRWRRSTVNSSLPTLAIIFRTQSACNRLEHGHARPG